MAGYIGRILRVNLTTSELTTIDTADYAQWGGGHGIGSAIFWDLIPDKTLTDGFDPRNVITIMTSPLSGTLVPAVAGRTEVQGIGVQSYPIGWFTRSNFGGRFAGMLKYAGWDGIVIEGKASSPVWIDIRDGTPRIKDAAWLWGKDTYQTQVEIWEQVGYGGDGSGHVFGKQKPAVLTIGAAGENQTRLGSLIHDAGSGAGQGGFGGVWGSKNLKAISVVGEDAVQVADPNELMEARIWAKGYGWDPNNPLPPFLSLSAFGGATGGAQYGAQTGMAVRSQGCLACHRCCRVRTETSHGNESMCFDVGYYAPYDQMAHGQMTDVTMQSADLIQAQGINVFEVAAATLWLLNLYQMGIAGPGLEIDTDLPFHLLGELDFAEQLVEKIIYRQGIGADLAEGCARAAEAWGRLEQDLATGVLPLQYWGYSHHYDARTEVEWGYGSILGDRDCNEHDFDWPCYWVPSMCAMYGIPAPVSAAELAQIIADACLPYSDPLMADYSDAGIYSEHMAKLVAWHRHYTRFWKQSVLYCDWAYADFFNYYGPNFRGLTPQAEPRFFNAVTGQNLTFEDGMEAGRKIWNLDRALWVLQGRHRDQEVFADYTYDVPSGPGFSTYEIPYVLPVYENGQWDYKNVWGRSLDRDGVEQWKTTYYQLEGWDPATGWPTRSALEGLGLGYVADELEAHGKLGAE
ncbi:MAG: aldehyde:ferredoxin oxidoreductase [Anaerolineae bacterium]|nr:aldehyde:ferredoxin oxidoreductase [Anaerolineae bacterium]NIN99579.1 aldehyde:ferredoxin oxidoreductase [Anaerolineae bacterium]NIQ82433.1 aldehyde:ferredoxin oxidoreductase [Anaerolineae bacterium]